MQSNNGNTRNNSGTRNSVPRMQDTTIKNINSSNKEVKQSAAPLYRQATSGMKFNEEEWKSTPSGIKYRENYAGGFRSNYSGNAPFEEGYGKGKKTVNVPSNSQKAALSSLYNFGYMILFFISIVLMIRYNAFKNVSIFIAAIFAAITLLKKFLIREGCLVNLIVYIFIAIFIMTVIKM